MPDGNRWLFAAGASAKVSHNITLDAAFAYIDFQSSTISRTAAFYTGTPAATIAQLTGEAEGPATCCRSARAWRGETRGRCRR